MKKILLIAVVALMSSCGTVNQMIIPKAVNTVGTATFSDMRLQRADYEVLKTVTAEAMVSYKSNRNGTNIRMMGVDEDFDLHYTYNSKTGWSCDYSGVIKLGYLSNDYHYTTSDILSPEDLARRLAIYRAINEVKFQGGDGLIEPTIATSVEQSPDKTITFKSVVTAKIIKIKNDKELQ